MLKKNASKITLLFCVLFYLIAFFSNNHWQKGLIYGGDSFGYYMYLPATFIHNDLDSLNQTMNAVSAHSSWKGSYFAKNPLGTDVAHHIGKGRQVIKYTSGLAILNIPLFAIAHVSAKLTGYSADGFSLPYRLFIHLSGILHAFLGLLFVRRILKKQFTDWIVAITLIAIALATNLYYFSTYNSAMAHPALFMLHALLILSTINFYKHFKYKDAILIGLSAGIITLIRPTEIICLLIPVLYGLFHTYNITNKLSLFIKKWPLLLTAIAAYITAGLPQLVYWKYTSGNWLYYSYGNEGFDFLNAKIHAGLFSFHNGWLAYTPVMYFAVLGMFILLFKRHNLKWPILTFIPLHIYIIYSWWCWYYINGFGSRPMVETYALLSIPFAICIYHLYQIKWLKYLAPIAITFFIYHNVFQTWQQTNGVLWSECANFNFVKQTFGKTSLNYTDLVVFDSHEIQPQKTLKLKAEIGTINFENPNENTAKNISNKHAHSGNNSFLTKQGLFTPSVNKKVKDLDIKAGNWIKASTWAYREHKALEIYRNNSLVCSIERNGKSIVYKAIRIDNKINDGTSFWGGKVNEWGEVSFYIKVPDDLQPDDLVKVFVWNNIAQSLFIDDVSAHIYKELD